LKKASNNSCSSLNQWLDSREPLKIHFGEQANLFDSDRRQEKAALASAKADFPSLSEYKNLLLAAQKQLLELPLLIINLSNACFFINGLVSSLL
jgi:hypothetical protein